MRTLPKFLTIIVLLMCLIAFIGVQKQHTSEMREYAALVANWSSQIADDDNSDVNANELRYKLALNCKHNAHSANFASVGQRGAFAVFYNMVRASKTFECHETITFTAPADYTFLDNLPTLVHRWRAPISVALYAPGDDFHPTLWSIAWLRHCASDGVAIRELVTFHVFVHQKHMPKTKHGHPLSASYVDAFNCTEGPPFMSTTRASETYRRRNNLTFPINVARNIARQTALTHYVFAADIELYPVVGFVEHFIRMMHAHPEYVRGVRDDTPRVFVLPIFEVKEGVPVPENKTALQALLKNGRAQLFHKKICTLCHQPPMLSEWTKAAETSDYDVFVSAKRVGNYRYWEAFYVGTKDDPLFDERLTWEGQSNKMTQGYAMCLLDYDYMVLNNAFIVHKPGIKKQKEQVRSFESEVRRTNLLIKRELKPMIIAMYGDRKGCTV